MGETNGISGDALDDVAYLSRSQSRVQILDLLATNPYTRSEVAERTEIARTTIDRIINELEERGWAHRTTDGAYAATPTGEHVVTVFRPTVKSMEAIRKLGDLVAWLPIDEVPIGLQHFTEATVKRPNSANPIETASNLTNLLRDASEFSCIVGVAPPLGFELAMRDGVVHRDLITDHVITAEELRYLLEHPERLPRWQEYLEAGADVYRYDGQVPCNLFVLDDTVVIGNIQSDIGEEHVWIETENETIRSWAYELIDTYRGEAEQLSAEVFAEDSFTPPDDSPC